MLTQAANVRVLSKNLRVCCLLLTAAGGVVAAVRGWRTHVDVVIVGSILERVVAISLRQWSEIKAETCSSKHSNSRYH